MLGIVFGSVLGREFGSVLGRVFGVVGKEVFEVLLMNELSALPFKDGGSTSCPSKVEPRILP